MRPATSRTATGMWTWCFRAELYTLFKIDPTRSADVLIEVLGAEFDGVLGCDYFSAYRRYMDEFGVPLQFCLAHLIRDVKFLTTLPDARDRAYGERLREALRELFAVIHRREQLSAKQFQSQLEAARGRGVSCGTTDVPATRHSRNLAKRFEKHGESYFRFITTPGVEPTNNLAEQAIRFVVIDRLITQGTRSEAGKPLVRADLDGDRDVRAARAIGVRVPGGGGRGVVRRDRAAVAVA